MADYLSQSFDFGVRIIMMSEWMKQEGKEFPLIQRLLECGAGLCVSMRVAEALNDRSIRVQAFQQIEEAECLLELMVKAGFLTELQSKPLLFDCNAIKEKIKELLGVSLDIQQKQKGGRRVKKYQDGDSWPDAQ